MLRQPASRCLRALPRRQQLPQSRTIFSRRSRSSPGRAREELNVQRLAQESHEYNQMRRTFLTAGAIAGIISFVYTAYKLKVAIDNKPAKLDSTLPPNDPLLDGGNRKVVLHDEQGRELVPTGNKTVEYFPRTIDLPTMSENRASSAAADPLAPPIVVNPSPTQQTTEYTLVGLGTRSVTFIGINVYVVGFYVATADIAALQSRLVKRVNPIATTLVAGEKGDLHKALLDPVEGEAIWNELLRDGIPARSAFRILPVRDTDFHHLRDGFVRAIQARSDKLLEEAGSNAGGDLVKVNKDAFGESMRAFRQVFNRGKVPKSKELLLIREDGGRLTVMYDDGKNREVIGTVGDERVSRALWLNYLAGKNVASEPARKSIADGVLEFVERPVGTVATQVL
ncbi:hypothetical protein PpBr36_07905 [Pyricularia pennisetigena]|uniref:hypothetical protein n=1 Tax=Pyricularia pennisetigena TaxID=1578925 RepID=UPI001154B14A|nr:hypothetical protein PpBr36_07905 [Pyricularia pennisetigena]TLS25793.1 hypothetical protein PpBr36_07905 [Pyricularia pennisetigena]